VPLLRLKENQPVTIEVTNHTDRPEVVHWHGLFTPPMSTAPSKKARRPSRRARARATRFTPRPAGFRWYHTHTMAMNDLTRGRSTADSTAF
jgi:FtsP/CotA-like multicopper oxidase with cupredoxin domain